MSVRAQILTGLRWSAGAKFGAQVLTWCITVVVIRLLSPADYGLLAIASLVVGFVALLSDAGLGQAVIQAANIDDDGFRRAFGLILFANLGLFLLILALAPGAAWFFGEAKLHAIISVQGIELLLRAFAAVPEARLQRQLEFKTRSLIEFAAVACGSLATLAAVLGGLGVWALVCGNLAGAAVRAVALNVACPNLVPRFDFGGARELLRFGKDWTLTQVLWFFYSQADVFIGGKILGKDALGYYSVALHLASLPVQRVTAILNQVTFPVFARMQGSPALAGQHVIKGLKLLSLVSFPVLWGISSIAPDLVVFVLGSKWQPAVIPLQVIALVMPLTIMVPTVSTIVQSLGRTDVILRNVVTSSMIMPTAFAVGSYAGIVGLSVAWAVAFPVVFAINMKRAMVVMQLRLSDVLLALAKPAAIGAVMYAAVSALRVFAPVEGPWKLTLLVPCGAVVYCAGAWWIDREGCRLLRSAVVSK